MKKYKTEQEDFWAGDFGNHYNSRNDGAKLLAANLSFLNKALRNANQINSCIEFGANIGMNLKALQLLYPSIQIRVVEINKAAAERLQENIPNAEVHNVSILDFEPNMKSDLVLIKGVLIHINPEKLQQVYQKLSVACGRYLVVAEYYNPSPVTVPYRGHQNRLFKRDFAGEILDQDSSFSLIDYGFIYHLDPNFPQDDITWFLLEKK